MSTCRNISTVVAGRNHALTDLHAQGTHKCPADNDTEDLRTNTERVVSETEQRRSRFVTYRAAASMVIRGCAVGDFNKASARPSANIEISQLASLDSVGASGPSSDMLP